MRKNDDRDGTDEVGGWALLLSSLFPRQQWTEPNLHPLHTLHSRGSLRMRSGRRTPADGTGCWVRSAATRFTSVTTCLTAALLSHSPHSLRTVTPFLLSCDWVSERSEPVLPRESTAEGRRLKGILCKWLVSPASIRSGLASLPGLRRVVDIEREVRPFTHTIPTSFTPLSLRQRDGMVWIINSWFCTALPTIKIKIWEMKGRREPRIRSHYIPIENIFASDPLHFFPRAKMIVWL